MSADAAISSLTAEVKRVNADLDRKQERIYELEVELAAVRKDRNHLESELINARTRIAALRKERDRFETSWNQAKDANVAALTRAHESEIELRQAQAINSRLNAQCAELEAENAKLAKIVGLQVDAATPTKDLSKAALSERILPSGPLLGQDPHVGRDADAVLHIMRNGELPLRESEDDDEETNLGTDFEGPDDEAEDEVPGLEIVTSLYVLTENGRPRAAYVTLDEAKQHVAGPWKHVDHGQGFDQVWVAKRDAGYVITRVPLAPPTTVLHRGTGLTDCASK